MTIATTGTEGCRLAGAQISVLNVMVKRGTAERNISIPVPAKNCRLILVEAVTTTVVGTADFVIDVELDTAGGSAIGTLTIPTSGSAVGQVTQLTWANMTQANAKNLSYDNASRDRINFEINLHASDACEAELHVFFEADY